MIDYRINTQINFITRITLIVYLVYGFKVSGLISPRANRSAT